MSRADASKVQSPTILIEMEVFACFQIRMSKAPTFKWEIFNGLESATKSEDHEDTVAKVELEESRQGYCRYSSVYYEL